jgi:hypothetical protein
MARYTLTIDTTPEYDEALEAYVARTEVSADPPVILTGVVLAWLETQFHVMESARRSELLQDVRDLSPVDREKVRAEVSRIIGRPPRDGQGSPPPRP